MPLPMPWNLAGFVLADGQRITVKGDWTGDDPRRSLDGVLSPDPDRAPHDHFHFVMGSYRDCR